MVCVPCFFVPVLLLLWRFLLWPLVRPLYVRWYNITDEKKNDTANGTIEKLDKLGEEGCPFGCPLKPKDSPAPVNEDKKTL